MKNTNNVSRLKVIQHPLHDVACLWALRILLDLNGINGLMSSFSLNDGEVLRTIGMGELEGENIEKKELVKKLRVKQKRYESKPPKINGILRRNIKQFGNLLGLSKHELKVFGFAVTIHSHRGLENTADILGSLSVSDVSYYLSTVLDLPVKKVRNALSSNGLLATSGILRLSRHGSAYLLGKLDLMKGLNEVLQEPQPDMLGMLQDYFQVAGVSTLVSEDFEYIRKDFFLISKYLSKVAENKSHGVNILVYGSPGTGKSEMVKTLASELCFNLYEISVADRDGDALTGNNRFSAYQLCQKILARQENALVLFDEVWCQNAANQGHIDAQVSLGMMYAQGRGVDKDEEKGFLWMKKAANQGGAESEYELCLMYLKSIGTEKDDSEAVLWCKKSAVQGHIHGQALLAKLYLIGRGVEKDEVKAVYWFSKASENGIMWAKKYLGDMYNEGKGVKQNKVTAKKLYKQACEGGMIDVCELL